MTDPNFLTPEEPEAAPSAAVDLMAALQASFARVDMVAPNGQTVSVLHVLAQKRLDDGYTLKEN